MRPGDPSILPPFIHSPELVFVEADAAGQAIDAATNLAGEGRTVVLDLPDLTRETSLTALAGCTVLAVGPSPLDEMAAGIALKEFPPEAAEPWLLGCDRVGGAPAATRFAQRIARHVPSSVRAANTLPTVLPPFAPHEIRSLIDGVPLESSLAKGTRLVPLLDEICSRPDVRPEDLPFEASNRRGELHDRLRDLADDLQSISDGVGPSAKDLEDAPVLEDWRYEHRHCRVLTGIVRGHPRLRAGRRIVTSELFASDGEAWGRVLNRYYKLERRTERRGSR